MGDELLVDVNAARVAGYLFVGGAPGSGPSGDVAVEIAALADLGVTDILDCRAEATPDARSAVESAGLGYATAPAEDGLVEPEAGWFDTGLEAARAILANPGSVLLTHCQGGRGRGPSMGFAVLLDRGVAPGEAFAAIKSVRPQATIVYAPHALEHHLSVLGLAGPAAEEMRAALADEMARWD